MCYLNIFMFIYLCIYVCGFKCHIAHMEVRGQPVGVHSVLPHGGSEVQPQVIRLGVSTFTHRVILSALKDI